jgi:hypothetical protein
VAWTRCWPKNLSQYGQCASRWEPETSRTRAKCVSARPAHLVSSQLVMMMRKSCRWTCAWRGAASEHERVQLCHDVKVPGKTALYYSERSEVNGICAVCLHGITSP